MGINRARQGGLATARKYSTVKFYEARAKYLGVKVPKTKKNKEKVNRAFLKKVKTGRKKFYNADSEAFLRVKYVECFVKGFIYINQGFIHKQPLDTEVLKRFQYYVQNQIIEAVDTDDNKPVTMKYIFISQSGTTKKDATDSMNKYIDDMVTSHKGTSFKKFVEVYRSFAVVT